MKLVDLIWLAVSNLGQKKIRTFFNLAGVVTGSVVVMLTFAGTRGVERGLYDVLQSNEFTRTIFIQPFRQSQRPIPDRVKTVTGDMDETRRQAIQWRLENEYRDNNQDWRQTNAEEIDAARQAKHVIEVIPRGKIPVIIRAGKERVRTHLGGVSETNSSERHKLIAGRMPRNDSVDELLIGEFLAYRLGFHSEAEAKEMVGTSVTLKVADFGGGILMTPMDIAFRLKRKANRLWKDLWEFDFKDRLNQFQREGFFRGATLELRHFTEWLTSEGDVESIERTFIVCGVVKEEGEDKPSLIPRFLERAEGDSAVGYRELERLSDETAISVFNQGAFARVDSFENITIAEKEIKESGLETFSIARVMENIGEQVSIAKSVVVGIGLIVLLISTFSIFNTLASSVFERTREFGIMKSLGAKDKQIATMVIMEGFVTGTIGALLGIGFAMGVSQVASIFVRDYVSYRIGQSYSGSIFVFDWQDFAVTGVFVVLACVAASIIPAIRAARLMPVEAIRR